MRTNIVLDDELVRRAQELTGIHSKKGSGHRGAEAAGAAGGAEKPARTAGQDRLGRRSGHYARRTGRTC